jgi:hypothetical protein
MRIEMSQWRIIRRCALNHQKMSSNVHDCKLQRCLVKSLMDDDAGDTASFGSDSIYANCFNIHFAMSLWGGVNSDDHSSGAASCGRYSAAIFSG